MSRRRQGVEGLGVLIVGAATGAIGRALAAGLAERGARVVRTGRAADRGEAQPFVQLDVTDPASVSEGIRAAADTLGRLDAVINASGITAQSDALETPLDEWNRVVATNLTGAFLVAQAAAKTMALNDPVADSRGSITTVASLCARAGCDGVAAYAASKAGVIGMTRSLASELAPIAIRVNALVPGVFLTPLNSDRLLTTRRGQATLGRTPMGRFGDVDELVGAAALLAGRDGSFMTGADVVVDGGFLASGIVQPELHEGMQ